jgi:ATP-dependent DNA ligase
MPSRPSVSKKREEVNCVPLSVVSVKFSSRLPSGSRSSTACSTAASASSVRQRCERLVCKEPVRLTETGRARWGEILDAEKMKKCSWVRPKLVVVIEFLEWTEGDRLRHSKFVALRDDKNPREVVKEG